MEKTNYAPEGLLLSKKLFVVSMLNVSSNVEVEAFPGQMTLRYSVVSSGVEASAMLSSLSGLLIMGDVGVSGPFLPNRITRSRMDMGCGRRSSSDMDNFCLAGMIAGGGTGCGGRFGSGKARCGGGTGLGGEELLPNYKLKIR